MVLFGMLQEAVQDVAAQQKPRKHKHSKITKTQYDQAFDDLVNLLFQEYKKKKQADRVNVYDEYACTKAAAAPPHS